MGEEMTYWERVSGVFQTCLQLPEEERKTWIQENIAPYEDKVAREVLKLLNSSKKANRFFDSLQMRLENDLEKTHQLHRYQEGDTIDKFRIKKTIGQGGMASVYLAERDDGQFDQQVAIKVLNSKNQGPGLKEKFRQEQQILAGINHPNIARLYDGGITPEGFPYIVMEYVDGLPLDEYCARQKPGLETRLKLFLQVGAALQHAHNNLIIHHDIKPGNILVDKSGQVKLLDFGISRVLIPDKKHEKDRSFAGTLRYASPEQMKSQPASVASDIYQLGLVLHKIITGKDLKKEITFRPSENQKVPHSRRICKGMNQECPNLKGYPVWVRNDFHAIMDKALREDPADRYLTVSDLMQDTRNLLETYPVKARSQTWQYITLKFLLRNKVRATLVLTLFLALLTGFLLFINHTRIIIEEKERAEQIMGFVWDIFDSSDLDQTRGETVTAIELLERSTERIEQLEDQPLLQAELFNLTGKLMTKLGNWEQAGPLFEKAQRHLPENNDRKQRLQKAKIHINQAEFLRYVSDFNKADSIIHLAINILEKSGRSGQEYLPEAYTVKAKILRHKGSYDQAIATIENAIALLEAGEGFPKLDLAAAMNIKASSLREKSELDEALQIQQKAYLIAQEASNQYNVTLLSSLSNLAILLGRTGMSEEALETSRLSLEKTEAFYGDDHPLTLRAKNNLAAAYHRVEKPEKADSLYLMVYEQFKASLGPLHEYTVTALYNLANSFYEQERYREALPYYYQALEADKEILGETHSLVGSDYTSLGMTHMQLKKWEKAEYYFFKAKNIFRENFGEVHPSVSRVYFYMGLLYGDKIEAEHSLCYLYRSVNISSETMGEDHPTTKRYQQKLAAFEERFQKSGNASCG